MACVSLPRAPTSSMSAASRPGRAPQATPVDEELRRVLPVVEDLAKRDVVGLGRHPPRRGRAGLPRCRRAASSTTSRPCATIAALLPLVAAAPCAGGADAPPRPAENKYDGPAYATSSRTCATSCSSAAGPPRRPASPATTSPSIPASASARRRGEPGADRRRRPAGAMPAIRCWSAPRARASSAG